MALKLPFWFKKEVLVWRTGASVGWSLLLTLPAVLLLRTILIFSPLHPLLWFTETLGVVSVKLYWCQAALLCLIVLFIALFNTSYYTVRLQYASTRLGQVIQVLHPSRLMHLAVYGVCGGAATWLLIQLLPAHSPFSGLTLLCTGQHHRGALCLNEAHLFVVLHSAFIGSLTSFYHFHLHKHILTFPLIQQSKLCQVRSKLFDSAVSSLMFVVTRTLNFYLLYYLLLGQAVKTRLYSVLRIIENVDVPPLDTVWGLWDLSLLWHVSLSASLVHFLFSLPPMLYSVYHTERVVFPVETHIEEDSDKCLHKTLSCSSLPLLQYLGYLDLHLLSHRSQVRRKQLFSLTQLGGHPLQWSRVSTECIQCLRELSDAVTAFNISVLPRPASHPPSSDTVPNVSSVWSASVHKKHSQLPGSQDQPGGSPAQKTGFLVKLQRVRVLSFLLGDIPELCSSRLFADAQKQTWAVSALSYLACASYVEDTYGVVQQSLDTIVREMLALLEALDRHMKLSILPGWKSNSGGGSLWNNGQSTDNHRKQALRCALKTGLHLITTTFNQHLNALSLSSEEKRHLQLFLDFKE